MSVNMSSHVSYCHYFNYYVVPITTSEDEVKTSVGQPTTLQKDNPYCETINQVVSTKLNSCQLVCILASSYCNFYFTSTIDYYK